MTMTGTQAGTPYGGVVTLQSVPVYDQKCSKVGALNMSMIAGGSVSDSTLSGGAWDASGSFEFPLSAAIDAQDASGHLATTTRSGSDGRYTLALPPGTYTLTVASPGPFPRCPTPTATVVADKLATLDIACDTGIR